MYQSDFCFCADLRLSDEDDENPSEEKSEDTANDDLTRAMPDALFEARKFAFVDFTAELINKHIEIATLIAQYHADTESIINDDKSETGRDGENAGSHSFVVSDRSKKGDREGSMRARHVTVCENVSPVEAVLYGIEGEFDDLYEDSDDNRNEKHR